MKTVKEIHEMNLKLRMGGLYPEDTMLNKIRNGSIRKRARDYCMHHKIDIPDWCALRTGSLRAAQSHLADNYLRARLERIEQKLDAILLMGEAAPNLNNGIRRNSP